ncbi:unnamed protein product [Agarophyton chilense]|eukprot:gb/GEZJ01005361.1/.p1 GENE.gb/GEZJ01005361.1/~~gb/GEZJ01005361.1/.p1  ORF type:complete len:354 (+),score=59.86 gb/GEZJ01005361.1/:31-1062(+)
MGASYSRAEPTPASTVAAAAAQSHPDPPKPQQTAPLTPFTSRILPPSDAPQSAAASKPPSAPWWRAFERSELPNPGGYEEISQDAMQILRPNLIEGMQFNFTAPISSTFALGNTIEMGAKDHPGQFAFNANYFTNRIVMMSRTTPSDRRVNGRIFINHTPALTSKIIADVGLEPDSSKASWDLDYRGSDFCSQLKFGNGVVAVSYLQSVAPCLAFGGEGFYQHKSFFSAITLAAKYFTSTDTASLSLSSFGPILANYVHRVSPKVSFATEIFVDARTRDSHLTLGYRFDLNSATVIGHVDSTGRVAATLEEKINPALTLTLSGELDHVKEDYKFGFGVNIGGA